MVLTIIKQKNSKIFRRVKLKKVFLLYKSRHRRKAKKKVFFIFENIEQKRIISQILIYGYKKLLNINDKIIGQKKFYCFKNNDNDFLYLKIKDKEIERKYTYREDATRVCLGHWFFFSLLNFEGLGILVVFEAYNEKKNEFKKGLLLYLYNNRYAIGKDLILLVKGKEELKEVILIFKGYLKKIELKTNNLIDYEHVQTKLLEFFNGIEDFKDFIFVFKFTKSLLYDTLLKSLKQLYLIYTYFSNNIINIYYKKKCINIKTRNVDVIGVNSDDIYIKNFSDFIGTVFLGEVDILLDNNFKIKRLILFFYNEKTGYFFYYLLDNIYICLIMVETLRESFIELKNIYTFLKEDFLIDIFDKECLDNHNYDYLKNLQINKENIKIIEIKDLEELWNYIFYYSFFLVK